MKGGKAKVSSSMKVFFILFALKPSWTLPDCQNSLSFISCMWRCPIKQHPMFLCEKIIYQPWFVQKPFFPIQTLFSLNTKWFYLFGTPLAPPGVKNSKMSLFWLFSRIPFHFRSDLHVGCHPEKFYNRFLSQNLFGSHMCIYVGKSGKNVGAKSKC